VIARREALAIGGRLGLIGLLGCAALLPGACGLISVYPTYHYRLTVEVDTPQGLRSGSSVIEVRASEVHSTLGGAGAEISGEAVAVDLPGGQVLFALLRSEASVDWAKAAMEQVTPMPPLDTETLDHRYADWQAAIRANTRLNVLTPVIAPGRPPFRPQPGYPMLVRFGDLRDPKSVEKVDPGNLAASFGPGFALRRITVQLTEDDVTTGIGKRLGWLGTSVQGYLDGQLTGGGPALSNILDTTAFESVKK
jgi:hypothetical protein